MNYLAKIEDLVGTVDGVNTDFQTPSGEAYQTNSDVLFIRGIPRVKAWDDGWTSLDPANGWIRCKEAPLPGDSIALLYAVEIADSIAEVEDLFGVVTTLNLLSAALEVPDALDGVVDAELLSGAIEEPEALDGVLDDSNELSGVIEVC